MANSVVRHGLLMRETFSVVGHNVAQWFPGHMAKGLNQMQKKLKSVDCIVEVHDARIPISGRNPLFEKTLYGIKPHVLILNKIDLANLSYRKDIIKHYNEEGIKHIIFTNCKKPDSRGVKSIIPIVANIIKESERYNRSDEAVYQLMIIGVPNVGKSSLINALRAKHLRRGKATHVGGLPGITQSVLEKIKVCEDPKVYLLDTPGVLAPKIGDVETGLKLALAATIKDHLVGEEIIADYLLYRLNKSGNHSYVKHLNLEEPTDSIQHLLLLAASKNDWKRRVKTHSGIKIVPNWQASAARFIKGFRTGIYGPITLDEVGDMKNRKFD